MIRVLFVCLGNICRSPMAEAIFRDLLKKEALSDKIKMDSAGLGHWHAGMPPHEGTQDVLRQHGISSDGLHARQLQKQDLQDFDYVVAMDQQTISGIERLGADTEETMVARLMDYDADAAEHDIPDPYLTGGFDYTYTLVSEGCRELLSAIRKHHNI
ncbi:protein-tyrosine-phosphatase [Barrientosiimonas marina]|uniref:protein-tyrosine-phosphatase n=1 Tax=Lentibacillus kimchii TaxID=1542911 RepID=A0ABW2UPY9_9BACI